MHYILTRRLHALQARERLTAREPAGLGVTNRQKMRAQNDSTAQPASPYRTHSHFPSSRREREIAASYGNTSQVQKVHTDHGPPLPPAEKWAFFGNGQHEGWGRLEASERANVSSQTLSESESVREEGERCMDPRRSRSSLMRPTFQSERRKRVRGESEDIDCRLPDSRQAWEAVDARRRVHISFFPILFFFFKKKSMSAKRSLSAPEERGRKHPLANLPGDAK